MIDFRKVDMFYVIFEPGDATLYKFIVCEVDTDVHVTKIGGQPFHYTFDASELTALLEEAPEVVKASYKDYRKAVLENAWLNERLFPFANDREMNPWTFLAAGVAALRVHESIEK